MLSFCSISEASSVNCSGQFNLCCLLAIFGSQKSSCCALLRSIWIEKQNRKTVHKTFVTKFHNWQSFPHYSWFLVHFWNSEWFWYHFETFRLSKSVKSVEILKAAGKNDTKWSKHIHTPCPYCLSNSGELNWMLSLPTLDFLNVVFKFNLGQTAFETHFTNH